MNEHVHRGPGEESRVNPWTYTVVEEGRMVCGGREFLYVVGDALVGSSCVGAGTLRYIHVPGFIGRWQFRLDDDGNPVSAVDPVMDDTDRAEIRNVLSAAYPGLQVCFSVMIK
ncbi:MAG TPA: hypothetical protein PLM53_03515 [Spirochaetota bacterium]|nr:hypothetical protein [Spirochaetota bacterium]HPC40282.1 hypothetical protein [Spirochaetota bacterium]HPL15325.1 hypothetical protein [Spirochaetota bacterium]HQF07243.1 hypothetical protein [Spirochaetota bacterium]HQH96144.1 hypothetical protein [Spirochaetota bacterium]